MKHPLRSIAKNLRKRETDAEKLLWSRLRAKQTEGLRFRRQEPIGRYIADFLCYEVRMVIEVDGGQHAEQKQDDEQRDHWMASQGFRVLRFWDNEVLMNIEGVLERITDHVTPSPSPSHRGRETYRIASCQGWGYLEYDLPLKYGSERRESPSPCGRANHESPSPCGRG